MPPLGRERGSAPNTGVWRTAARDPTDRTDDNALAAPTAVTATSEGTALGGLIIPSGASPEGPGLEAYGAASSTMRAARPRVA